MRISDPQLKCLLWLETWEGHGGFKYFVHDLVCSDPTLRSLWGRGLVEPVRPVQPGCDLVAFRRTAEGRRWVEEHPSRVFRLCEPLRLDSVRWGFKGHGWYATALERATEALA